MSKNIFFQAKKKGEDIRIKRRIFKWRNTKEENLRQVKYYTLRIWQLQSLPTYFGYTRTSTVTKIRGTNTHEKKERGQVLREIHFINRISVEKAALVSVLVISPETASTNLWSKLFLRNREIRLDASNKQPQGLMERWWLVSSVRNSRIKASMRGGVNNWSSLSSIIWV